MEKKDKLMKLIKEARNLPNAERCVACPPTKSGKRPCEQCQVERMVDYLIANGVTVEG